MLILLINQIKYLIVVALSNDILTALLSAARTLPVHVEVVVQLPLVRPEVLVTALNSNQILLICLLFRKS